MRYVLSNWKMYPTIDEGRRVLGAVQEGLRERLGKGIELPQVIICPPHVALVPLRAEVDADLARLGAQNCHWEAEGPHTGEISPRMLQGLVDYVMVGHSERRAAGETDEQVARKVNAVAGAGLVPILFVGEDEKGEGDVEQTEHRLRVGISGIDVTAQRVLFVYEPAWAIGAEHAAPVEHVTRVVVHVKRVLRDVGASQPEVLYGGTVADDNIDEFAAIEALDGVGATRAGLDPQRFLRLVDRVGAGPAR